MGSVARRALLALVVLVAVVAFPMSTVGFSGFGSMTASATFGGQMRFSIELPGGPPDRLELLLRFASSPDSTVVAPVDPGPSSAEYVWDTAARPLTPNTNIAYRWRATSGNVVTLSPEKTILYDDDRPGLDWHTAKIGLATVHWYGGAEAQARHRRRCSGTTWSARSTSSSTPPGMTSSASSGRERASGPAPPPSRRCARSSCGWVADRARTSRRR